MAAYLVVDSMLTDPDLCDECKLKKKAAGGQYMVR
jgi:hypothetical protein